MKLVDATRLVLPVLLLLTSVELTAAPGDVDPGYGDQGTFRTGETRFALELSDGGLLLVSARDADYSDAPSNTWVQRVDADGRQDAGYGTGGGIQLGDGLRALTGFIRGDGGMLLGGASDGGGGFVAAFDAQGRPMEGDQGALVRTLAPVTALVEANERIYVAEAGPYTTVSSGSSSSQVCFGDGWSLSRLRPDLEFDRNWGRRTSREVEGATTLGCQVRHLWVERDGKVVLAGDGRGLVRLQPDGTRDLAYGEGLDGNDVQGLLMRMADGGFLSVTGPLNHGVTRLTRVDADGRPVGAFGGGRGYVEHDLGNLANPAGPRFESVEGRYSVPDDGRYFYAVVSAYEGRDEQGEIDSSGEIIARFHRDGRLDTGFGQGGVVRITVSRSLDDVGLFPRADGSLLFVTRAGVLRFSGDARGGAGLIDAVFVPGAVTEGDKARLVVSRTAGSSGAISVEVGTDDWYARPGLDYVPTGARLDWADGEGGTRVIEIQTLDDGADGRPNRLLAVQVNRNSGVPVVMSDYVLAAILDKPSSNPPPSTPPPATPPPSTPPPSTGTPGSGSGGGGALGAPECLMLGAMLLMAGPLSRRRRGGRVPVR